jgi:hypothetical protein
MNAFTILFLTICGIVISAGVMVAIKANKMLRTLKAEPVRTKS